MSNFNNTPEIGPYVNTKPFRFWCQKVIPLVYDESLSYYELLCKVIDYLNKVIADMTQVITDMGDFQTAYEEFITAINLKVKELEDFIDQSFDELNLQNEVNIKLDQMAENGYFDFLFNDLSANVFVEAIGVNVNNTAAENSALLNDAIGDGNKTFIFSKGEYLFDSINIIDTQNVEFIGLNNSKIKYTGSGSFIRMSKAFYINFKDLNLIGPSQIELDGVGIDVFGESVADRVVYYTFENCRVYYFDIGLKLRNYTWTGTFNNTIFRYCNSLIDATLEPTFMLFNSCILENAVDYSLYCHSCAGKFVFQSCLFESNTGADKKYIYSEDLTGTGNTCSHFSFIDCYFEDSEMDYYFIFDDYSQLFLERCKLAYYGHFKVKYLNKLPQRYNNGSVLGGYADNIEDIKGEIIHNYSGAGADRTWVFCNNDLTPKTAYLKIYDYDPLTETYTANPDLISDSTDGKYWRADGYNIYCRYNPSTESTYAPFTSDLPEWELYGKYIVADYIINDPDALFGNNAGFGFSLQANYTGPDLYSYSASFSSVAQYVDKPEKGQHFLMATPVRVKGAAAWKLPHNNSVATLVGVYIV